MLFWATLNQVSNIVRVKILDSAVTTGAGKTGLAFNTSGLVISTIASNESVGAQYTVAANNIENVTTLGTYVAPTTNKCRFREVSPTNHPGIYEIQFANARFAVAGSRYLLISISGAAGMAQCDGIIPLPVEDMFLPGMGSQELADIKAAIQQIFLNDATTELGTGPIPLSTAPMFDKLNWVFKLAARVLDSDGGTVRLFNSDNATVGQKRSTSVAGSTVTKGPWQTGP